MWAKLSAYFFRGLFTLLPLLITVWLLLFIFNFFDGILGGVINLIIGHSIPGLGFAITVVIILLTGVLVTYVLGERLFKFGEALLYKVPIIKSIYSSAKQINDVLFMQKKEEEDYRHACVVEYPSPGIYSLGFITSEVAQEIEKKTTGTKMVNVFIANTPTPATGFLIMLPVSKVKVLEMHLDEAFKYVVSGGVLKPSK